MRTLGTAIVAWVLVATMVMLTRGGPVLAEEPAAAGAKRPYFRLAIAEPLRHNRLEEVADDIARYRSKGYNAVFFENDYLRWTFRGRAPMPGSAVTGGCSICSTSRGDATGSSAATTCGGCAACAATAHLDVYASFWLPQLTTEFRQYLHGQHPDAIGRTGPWRGRPLRPFAPARTARA